LVKLRAVNEWDALRTVVVGTAQSMGGIPTVEESYDPKSKEHILAGTFPQEADCARELEGLGAVVDDRVIITRMISDRAEEWEGIAPLLESVPDHLQLNPPPGVRVEGGDVMPMNGEIWVGYSAPDEFSEFTTSRTNQAALDWLSDQYPDWNVRGFQLSKSDVDPRANALHLDCCLSVLSGGHAIFHPEGLRLEEDRAWVRERFGNNVLEVDAQEMYDMQCNLISITPQDVISCPTFERVNAQLESWGYNVFTTPLQETAKMEGLLRCVTLPLQRQA
jgi:N-dimethylarginine dimethylaminohydrolase